MRNYIFLFGWLLITLSTAAQPQDSLSPSQKAIHHALSELSRQINEPPTLNAYILRGQMKQVIGDTLGA